jgi:hypothetical protein
LGKIELGGIDKQFNWHIRNIYALQKKQWQETGVLTAVGEDSMNRLPWFSYENLYWQGDKWIPTTHTGSPISRPVMLSSKAALAWSAIFPDKYSPALRLSLNGLIQKGGVYAGIYANGEINKSLNINTNAVILEILLFKKMQGKSFLNLNAS